ncbi:MAG: SurA N-terminal domain-containing protein [Sneathiellaceae bacterium]
MLTQLRKSAGTWMVKALMLLLVASFALWGIGDYLGGGGEVVVAEVGGQPIEANQFENEFRQQLARVQQQMQQRIDPQQAKDLGLVNEFLQQQIDQALLEQTATRIGLRAPDDLVRALIVQNPVFRGNGEFDRLRFQNFLAQAGMTENMYIAVMREELRSRAIADSLTAGKAPPPQTLTVALRDHVGERRRVDFIVVPKSAIAAPQAPEPADLRAYHAAHPKEFTAPELRSLSWISLSPETVAASIEIDEPALRAAFEERRDSLSVAPTRDLRQVVTQDEETARAVAETMAAGGGLDQAAAQAGAPAPTTLGTVSQDDLAGLLGAGFADQVFAATQTGSLAPLQSDLGWHVVEVTGLSDGNEPGFEDVRDQLARDLKHEIAVDRIYGMANEVEDMIAGGATLKEIAETMDLPLQSHPGIDATGRDIDGAPADIAPGFGGLRRELWRMEPGGEPETFENDAADGFTVVQLNGVAPPRVRPFEEVEGQVRGAWAEARRAEQAGERAAQMARELQGGTSLKDIAAAAELTVRQPAPFTRLGDGADLPFDRALMEEIFAAPVGAVISGSTDRGNAVLARIEEILPAAQAEQADELLQRLSQRWSGGFKRDMAEAFRDSLANRAGVVIHQDALDSII